MKIIARNKKARFNYEILEKYEAGIVLRGSEVKSLRLGNANINDAFARFIKGELYLINAHIAEYQAGGAPKTLLNHDSRASRKLLMHQAELNKLLGKIKEKSLTLIPLKMYFNAKNWVKVEIALGRGKKLHDKRETLKKREADRESAREIKNYQKG